jgi:4-hydroxybenzoate polyprenyltransferase
MIVSDLTSRIRAYGSLVAFPHSVFALPFALIMLLSLAEEYRISWTQVTLLIICVVSARTAAMAFNRLVDSGYDARNARTISREIPSGVVSIAEASALVVVTCSIFVVAASALGSHCGVLALPVLAVLLGYSFVKRFSSACHFVLGLALALAPGGVWYALTGVFSWRPVPLMASVLLWVAGFDILYACQDAAFDAQHGLQSIPSRYGILASLRISALMHLGCILMLAVFGINFQKGALFWLGVAVFSILIASQHIAVRRTGIECIDRVFFTRNGMASVVLLLCTALDF